MNVPNFLLDTSRHVKISDIATLMENAQAPTFFLNREKSAQKAKNAPKRAVKNARKNVRNANKFGSLLAVISSIKSLYFSFK